MIRDRFRAAGVLAVTAALALSALIAVGAAAPASAKGVNPAWNVSVGGSSAISWYFGDTNCQRRPASSRCEDKVVRALDHARRSLGKPAYRLPKRFGRLSSREQLLVLVNDDRQVYGLPLVRGLNVQLDAKARAGAKANIDPLPYGSGWTAVATNWAGGMNSPLFAYYSWMYADGLNHDGSSVNMACTRTHPAGCWGHRDNVLRSFGGDSQLVLGIGYARTAHGASWTQLFQAYPANRSVGYLPTVTGLTARSGPASGASTLTISGYGFVRVNRVRFGAVTAKITSRGATHLSVVVPPHRPGAVHIVVVTAGGSSSQNAAAAYSYR